MGSEGTFAVDEVARELMDIGLSKEKWLLIVMRSGWSSATKASHQPKSSG